MTVSQDHPSSQLLNPFSPAEVSRAISALKNNKACGKDDIPNEFIKCLGERGIAHLTEAFNKILETNQIPPSWNSAVTKLIPKGKGKDPTSITSYRPIAILSNMYKLYGKLLKQRMNYFLEERQAFGTLQFGFRPGRSVNDSIFLMTQLIERAKKTNSTLYLAFLDIKGAYDNVDLNLLWQTLPNSGLPQALITHLSELYENSTTEYVWNDVTTPPILNTGGLRQGCPLSSTLFSLYLRPLEERLSARPNGVRLQNSSICPGSFYADDVGLATETPANMQNSLDDCSSFGQDYALEFSHEKSVILTFNPPPDSIHDFHIQGKPIKQVSRATYLGLELCNDHEDFLHFETSRRIAKAKRLKGMIKNCSRQSFNRYEVARTLWKQVAVPALTYASESLSLPSSLWTDLDKIQLEVGRFAVGASLITPNVCIEGDMGWSPFPIRTARAQNAFEGKILNYPDSDPIRSIYDASCPRTHCTPWHSRLWKSRLKHRIQTSIMTHRNSKDWRNAVTQAVNDHNERRWRKDIVKKQSLSQYQQKTKPQREYFFDNSLGSDLLFQARAGSLPTAHRHFEIFGTSPCCPSCHTSEETLTHVLFECQALDHSRRKLLPLIDPNDEEIRSRTILQLLQLTDGSLDSASNIKLFLEDWWRITRNKLPYWR